MQREHNYVIGYKGDGQVVYGQGDTRLHTYANLMTLAEAKKEAKKTWCWNNYRKVKTVVYKLVEIKLQSHEQKVRDDKD